MYDNWKELLEDIWSMPDCNLIRKKIGLEYKRNKVYPKKENIFKAFKLCPFPPKVVIIGQDPYPQPGVADGLAFSTQKDNLPFSLKVIFKEIKRTNEDLKIYPSDTNLSWWAKQGVLLLNTSLTVKENEPASHAAIWKPFTLRVVQNLVTSNKPIVWMLWGNHAKAYKNLVIKKHHLVLTSDHPASEKRNGSFIGNDHFVKCNEYLEARDLSPIYWVSNLLPF